MAPRLTSPGPAALAPVVAAVAVRPGLWATALRQLAVLAAPGWWRRAPHLPLPSPAYLRFRMVTAYGDPEATPTAVDVVTYLGWCREARRRAGGAGNPRLRPAAGR